LLLAERQATHSDCGQIVKYEGLREMTVEVTAQRRRTHALPRSWALNSPPPPASAQRATQFARQLAHLPVILTEWLRLQRRCQQLPPNGRLLIEASPRWPAPNGFLRYAVATATNSCLLLDQTDESFGL